MGTDYDAEHIHWRCTEYFILHYLKSAGLGQRLWAIERRALLDQPFKPQGSKAVGAGRSRQGARVECVCANNARGKNLKLVKQRPPTQLSPITGTVFGEPTTERCQRSRPKGRAPCSSPITPGNVPCCACAWRRSAATWLQSLQRWRCGREFCGWPTCGRNSRISPLLRSDQMTTTPTRNKISTETTPGDRFCPIGDRRSRPCSCALHHSNIVQRSTAGIGSPGRLLCGGKPRRIGDEEAEVAWRLTRYEVRQAQKGAASNRSTDERPEKTIGRNKEEKRPSCAPSAQVSDSVRCATSAMLPSAINVLR
jgi:hypothetical protein